MRIVVTGAGGMIAGYLVKDLIRQSHDVIAVDIKPIDEWWQVHPGIMNYPNYDLSEKKNCYTITKTADQVYNLAADMGGIGFITNYRAECGLSALISLHMLMACRDNEVEKLFYSSSACVYRYGAQSDVGLRALKEEDAWPAQPEEGYGMEKLFTEEMCRLFSEDYNLATRVARYHNVYGPHGTFDGGREKAPAAICRKVAQAKLSGVHEINIWGDGKAERSFMFVDDCVEGTQIIMDGDHSGPVNLGSSELVSVDQLVDIVEDIAGVKLKRTYDTTKPEGVRGRNSDNTLIQSLYNWEPSITLREGLEKTYAWIFDEVSALL